MKALNNFIPQKDERLQGLHLWKTEKGGLTVTSQGTFKIVFLYVAKGSTRIDDPWDPFHLHNSVEIHNIPPPFGGGVSKDMKCVRVRALFSQLPHSHFSFCF